MLPITIAFVFGAGKWRFVTIPCCIAAFAAALVPAVSWTAWGAAWISMVLALLSRRRNAPRGAQRNGLWLALGAGTAGLAVGTVLFCLIELLVFASLYLWQKRPGDDGTLGAVVLLVFSRWPVFMLPVMLFSAAAGRATSRFVYKKIQAD
jgi:hypothetical protein